MKQDSTAKQSLSRAAHKACTAVLAILAFGIATFPETPRAQADVGKLGGFSVEVGPACATSRSYSNADASADVAIALRYLRKSGGGRALLRRIEDARADLAVVVDPCSGDSTDFGSGGVSVTWNPHAAMLTREGGVQSPAVQLAHELLHALHAIDDLAGAREAAGRVDSRYDTAEEMRTIVDGESVIARELGESTRTDHEGFDYAVSSPTARS